MIEQQSRRTAAMGLGAALALVALPRRSRSAEPRWTARQFHNQPVESHLHRFLVELWSNVQRETGGRLGVTVEAQNGGVAGSDPGALDRLVDGRLEFFCVMGGILGRVVPVAEIQGVPFAFADHAQVYRALDGRLGAYLARECAAKGIHYFPKGLMENGFRHIGMVSRPIRTVDDLAGVRMRVPDGEMFRSLFTALGAVPVTVNIDGLYAALKDGRVDGQENPLVVTEFNRLYEVTRYVSLTSHMWSGFNLLANGRFWAGLPAEVQQIVTRNVVTSVARQRAFTNALNDQLATSLAARGLIFNTADTASFRSRLGPAFYGQWKARLGSTAWSLLEADVGRLG